GRRVEARQHLAVLAADDRHLRAAGGVGTGNDVGEAVGVDIARRHEGAAGELRRQREEVADWLERLAVEYRHLRPRAGAGGADDVRGAVGVDVAQRHTHAAEEAGRERVEAGNQRPGARVEDIDQRRTAAVGPRDDHLTAAGIVRGAAA